VMAAVSKFMTGYKGTIPTGDEKQISIAEIQVQQIFNAHAAHVSNNPAAFNAFAELWAPRLPLGSNWERITTRAAQLKQDAELMKLLPIYANAVRAAGAANASPAVWRTF